MKGTPDIRIIVTGSQTAWAPVNGPEDDLSWSTPRFQHRLFTSAILPRMTVTTQKTDVQKWLAVTTQQVLLPISCVTAGRPCKRSVDYSGNNNAWEEFMCDGWTGAQKLELYIISENQVNRSFQWVCANWNLFIVIYGGGASCHVEVVISNNL